MPKKKKVKKKESKRYSKFKVEAGSVVRPRYCPRCGSGVIFAKLPGRFYCGRCRYTEYE
ncbi:MAG: 30S ribosomal protein S27ae [Nanoarchaeota archaeon]